MSTPVLSAIEFDPALPINAWHDEIAATIRDHQVVVVAGETGSGKTTQLPKICLELGRRSIGHTQPRRIAARTVAERIAEELHVGLGELVGYQVRFTRRAGRDTRLKVMTDGVLLAEIGHDRELRRYDTIIIDEAHERSLNIDFLLGYLRRLLPRRPDLKVIVTSATIDTERFSAHFAGPDGVGAPIIEVSGRTYPVEVRYRPLLTDGGDGQADQVAGVCAAVQELSLLGGGDILVFLSGEREIRDTADALAGLRLRDTEVLPLYARLSAAEQHRVFERRSAEGRGSGGRRIVLATNVAETSLTVPGIRYVVDAGTARISRYSARTKVQRLPIEPISRASANQRSGRCGRVAPGVAIRLYSEEDYLGRPEFTEPEILRTNLAAVILQMAAAELGDITDFPFVEPPDNSQVTDGLRLLEELGALAGGPGARHQRSPRLTEVGRRLAAIPVDPRMGRMLLAAERQGCLREMLVVVAALSIQDPRERPAEQREAADALHRRFWAPLATPDVDDPTDGVTGKAADAPADRRQGAAESVPPEPDGSDLVAYLRLWDYLRERQRHLSGNAFRRLCRDEFLHFLRVREWQDLHAQLKEITRDLGLSRNADPAAPDRLHTAALAGLLSHVGLAEVVEEQGRGKGGQPGRRRSRATREYLGARGTRFAINLGSSLARSTPPLVVAAEIVETTRLWARTCAAVTAEQVEEVGQHLLTRQYSEPHWSTRSGSVLAYEQVSLYGVPIVARRPVSYGRVNPAEARAIFVRAALVEGQWRTRHHFFRDNQALRAEAEALEERARRRDLVVDDDVLFAFYDARVPAEITSVAHFDAWWKKERHVQPDLLTLSLDDLTTGAADHLDPRAFPDSWTVAGAQGAEHTLDVRYSFEPGRPTDGVTVRVPVPVLGQLDPAAFSGQVPGLRAELATELVRSLPKATRRAFVPAPQFAARALARLRAQPDAAVGSFPHALAGALTGLTGQPVDPDAFDLAAVPAHLRVHVEVVADDGRGGEPVVVDVGDDLGALQQALAPRVTATLSQAGAAWTRTGMTRWEAGELPTQVSLSRSGHEVLGYPALVDEGGSVGVAVLDAPGRQAAAHTAGLRRLVALNTPDPTNWVVAHLSNVDKLALAGGPYPNVPALLADARLASVGELVRRSGRDPRAAAAFGALCDVVRADNPVQMQHVVRLAARVVTAHRAVAGELARVRAAAPEAAADLTEQLANLVFPGFLAGTPAEHLAELPRYLQAAQTRVSTLLATPARDRAPAEVVARCEDAYAALCDACPPGRLPPAVEEVGWLLEELRVSLFAQSLRTRVPVSEKRVNGAIAAARAGLAG